MLLKVESIVITEMILISKPKPTKKIILAIPDGVFCS